MSREIEVNGRTVAMGSGEELCLGTYLDADGEIWAKFGLSPGTYNVDDVVADIEYYDDISEWQSVPVSEKYRGEP